MRVCINVSIHRVWFANGTVGKWKRELGVGNWMFGCWKVWSGTARDEELGAMEYDVV